jgi:Tol biopolymer transport system component
VTSLYSVAPGGGPVHKITTSRSLYWSPALSPDGSRIATVGNPCAGLDCSDPSSSILVLSVDGSGERTLATPAKCAPGCCGNYDESPTWSPNGATILFGEADCNTGTGMPELYTVPASGGTPHDLGFKGYSATWGPSKIAYVNDDSNVWTANPDGTDPVAVGSGMSPAWSPTGQLAYLKNNGDVVVGSTRMRFPFASVTSLAWSPDGTRLVVSARKTATSPTDLYSINPNGSDPIQLTQNYDAYGPSWR